MDYLKIFCKINITLVLILFVSPVLKPQDMELPPPVNIPAFDKMDGKWESEPYDMMGLKVVEKVEHDWKYNHQYFVVDIEAAGEGFEYKGKGYFTANKNNEIIGWWFDGYGPEMMALYSGKADGNKITLKAKNQMYSEIRIIEINGDVMVHNVTQKFKGSDGKEQETKLNVTYHKKKK